MSASIALGLAVALAMPSAAFGVLPFSTTTILNTPAYWYDAPVIDGRYIAVTRGRNDGTDRDVVLYNRRTGAPAATYGAADGVSQDYCGVSGDRVVWVSHAEADGEVWYDDLSDGSGAIRVTNDTRDDVGAVIDGNLIAWVDGIIPGRTIRFYDIEQATMGTVDVCNLPNGLAADMRRVAWFDVDKRSGYEGVYVYDVDTTAEIAVREVDYSVRRIVPTSIDIHGDFVTWCEYPASTPDNKDVYVASLRTSAVGPITNHATTQESPAVFGDLLAWQDDRTTNQDILAWWAPETPGFQDVARTTATEAAPDVYGHAVAHLVNPGLDSDVGLAVADLTAQRLSGGDRYATSALISENRFPTSSIAVLATGSDFPDALAASPLAGALRCPLLLTAEEDIPDSIADELERLAVLGVFIVGGEAVIGEGVTDELDDMGITWTRLAGDNRYATARAVANRLIDVMGNENRPWRREAFFVRGDDYADALAIAPHAYALGTPILLVQTNAVPTDTRDAVLFLNIDDGYVIGGTSAISNATQTTLNTYCGNPTERWAGANRYDTAALCAQRGFDYGWLDFDRIGVATGMNFPDALGGGAACGYYGSPIVLTSPTSVVPVLANFLLTHRYDFGGMEVYGGIGAVSAPTFTQLEGYLD